MQDIADRIGVTRATVSLALRNSPQISRSRREEIHRVAEELGYRPNPMISSLMANLRESRPIPQHTGLFFLHMGKHMNVSSDPMDHMSHYFSGAQEQAAKKGFRLESFPLRQSGMSSRRIEKIIRSRGIPGVIIAPGHQYFPLPDLPWSTLSTVMIGRSYPGPEHDRIFTNFYSSARIAVRKLDSTSHKDIRLILPEEHDRNTDQMWSAGYLQEIQDRKRFHPPLIVQNADQVVAWVQQNPFCTVLGTNQILDWLNAGRDNQLPFTFVSLNVEGASALSGIQEPHKQIGKQAMDLLIGKILLNQTGFPKCPVSTLMEPSWQQGDDHRVHGGAVLENPEIYG